MRPFHSWQQWNRLLRAAEEVASGTGHLARCILFGSFVTSEPAPNDITRYQQQLERLRRTESNAVNYRLSAAGFLAELDRMNLELREYLQLHRSEVPSTA